MASVHIQIAVLCCALEQLARLAGVLKGFAQHASVLFLFQAAQADKARALSPSGGQNSKALTWEPSLNPGN